MFDNFPDVLTTKQIAQCLPLSRSKLYQLLAEGEIPNRKIGSKIYSTKDDLIDFITSNMRRKEAKS